MPIHPLMTTGTLLLLSLCVMHPSKGADDAPPAWAPAALQRSLDHLPAPASGRQSAIELRIEMQPPAQPALNAAHMGGATAAGRVTAVYLRLGQGLFISIERAPSTLRQSNERWVEVQFPHADNRVAQTPAYVNETQTNIEVGDAVEIRFAHPVRSRVFPVPEVTRVTGLIAKSHEPLARLYGKQLDARIEDDASNTARTLDWLVRTVTAQ